MIENMSINERVARSVALEQAYVYDVYEQLSDNLRSRPWPKVEDFLNSLDPGSLVCDVGSGNGKYLNTNKSIFTMGGDKSTRLCEVARTKESEVLVLDNLSLPYRDDGLDAVLSIAVIHHFTTTERRVCALRELARVLRIGGRLIISVWAMEQSHRKFESQDVLVPWRKPKHTMESPLLEFAPSRNNTTTTTMTTDEECMHLYIQTSDSDSSRSSRAKKTTRSRDTSRNLNRNSPGNSSLSSPNETCYSFVRKAIQKLAAGRRVNRPWFLESWTNCTKDPPPKRYDPDGCECCDCDNVQDLPIELRRVDDEEMPQRRQTFPSSQLINELYGGNVKSRSLTNIKTVEAGISRSQSSIASIPDVKEVVEKCLETTEATSNRVKPKLVKQKHSICEEDAEEALDKPTDMQPAMPDVKIHNNRLRRSIVTKQRSLNEELMSTDRIQEKETLRRHITKQTSLNEELICQRPTDGGNRDSFFSTTRLQLFKTGFTNRLKNSTNNIEKVTKNGFVKMFQTWKTLDIVSPSTKEDSLVDKLVAGEEKRERDSADGCERRLSKEEGSDSSKDSSLQSDTSVDSEDSFASVIFVPKSDPMSPTLSSNNSSIPNSPRIKQSSCPTSPRIKQMPLSIYPLTKQLSSPKPSSSTVPLLSPHSKTFSLRARGSGRRLSGSLRQKYAVQQIPKFKKNLTPVQSVDAEDDCCLLDDDKVKAKTGGKSYPLVRQASVATGSKNLVKPLPKLLSLELFNPETDDKDSDSSAVSSPDSVDSVISVGSNLETTKFQFQSKTTSQNFLQAAKEVANSLDEAVGTVIRSSPRAKRKEHLKVGDIKSIIEREYSSETTPLLLSQDAASWNEECQRHLTDFADQLSEKLKHEITQYQGKASLKQQSDLVEIDDPYITRLSEELQDLSKLSAEIQKQNEYLAKLSASDDKLIPCGKCKSSCYCKCQRVTKTKSTTQVASSSKLSLKSGNNDFNPQKLPNLTDTDSSGVTSKPKIVVKSGASIESCDSEKGSSSNSVLSSTNTSLHFGHSIESADGSNDHSVSRYSDGGSTASLASCPEWKTIRNRVVQADRSASEDKSPLKTTNNNKTNTNSSSCSGNMNPSLSDTSQESLPSDNVGGEITYHRFYHVFREGELDQLIEQYVENLHIIRSYYDHASWCIVAEKVQVWTI